MRHSLQVQLDRIARDRWARRGVSILLRSAWIALSIWCIGVGVHLLFDWSLQLEWLGALSLACIAIGAVLVLRPRMKAEEVARRLDRRFRLDEQLATALETNGEITQGSVEAYLYDHARHTSMRVRRYVNKRQSFPWLEVVTILALALVLSGLLFLTGINPLRIQASAEGLPGLVQPGDELDAFPEEPFTPPQQEQAVAEAAQQTAPPQVNEEITSAIADALRDQSVTRPAADALDQGDLAGAAQSLRELADQSDRISPEARSELAQSLRDAANEIQDAAPEVSDALQNSADGLEQGGQQAADALENLASTVEQLGQPGTSTDQQADGAGDGAGESEQAQDGGQDQQGSGGAGNSPFQGGQQQSPTDRLNVEGVPLELESEGEGDTPAERSDQPSSAGAGSGGGFEQGSSASNSRGGVVETGDDPLRIPAELRDVVQEYFSP